MKDNRSMKGQKPLSHLLFGSLGSALASTVCFGKQTFDLPLIVVMPTYTAKFLVISRSKTQIPFSPMERPFVEPVLQVL